jgi:AcrR family transcriptional regulator
MAALVEAAIEIGLDRFTLADVAARVEVGESTVYGYVASRQELLIAAAGQVFEGLDLECDAPTWTEYIEVLSERVVALAVAHPGLADYVLWGPYTEGTLALFERLVARVQAYLPDVPDHVAWALASRPFVLGLTYLGDPLLEPLAPWIRKALIEGLASLVEAGELPAEPLTPWRTWVRS